MDKESRKLVVIAESDKEVNQLISSTLKLHGLEVYSVYDHEQFLHLLQQMNGSIDAVFINGRLASERGGLLVSRTKQSDTRIKVLVIADNDESDRAQILRYGADEYIEKPVSSETILAKTLSLLATKNND